MCMEDVRIARKCNTTEFVVAIDNATTKPVVGANNKRVAIHFACLGGGNSFVTMRRDAAVGSGVALPFFGTQRSYNIWQHGDLPTRAFYGSNDAGAAFIVVWETVLLEE